MRSRRLALATTFAALGTLCFPALTLAGATPAGPTIGKFTFSGELGGSLKVPKKWNLGYTLTQVGCEQTVDTTSLNLFLYNVKLALNGRKTALTGGVKGAAIPLFVAVEKYGDTESVADLSTPEEAPDFKASIGINAFLGRTLYSWSTNTGSATEHSSGTITTNAKGTSGSLQATLIPSGTGTPTGVEGHATAPLHVSGSWSYCKPYKP
jgi:hypothetical protein